MSFQILPAMPPMLLKKLHAKSFNADAQSYSITGLSMSGFRAWILYGSLINNNASACTHSLYVNNDTTAANYQSQVALFTTTATSSRSSTATLGNSTDQNYAYNFEALIRLDAAGYYVAQINGQDYASAAMVGITSTIKKTATAADITEIDIVGNLANDIKTGSWLELYGVVA